LQIFSIKTARVTQETQCFFNYTKLTTIVYFYYLCSKLYSSIIEYSYFNTNDAMFL